MPELGLVVPFLATSLCEPSRDTKLDYGVINIFDRLAHIVLAVPSIRKKSLTLTLTAKLSKSQGKIAQDTKASVQPMVRNAGSDTESDGASDRSRSADDEQPRQPVEDLV